MQIKTPPQHIQNFDSAPDKELRNRNQKYKESILNADYEVCIERARYYTQVFRETEGQKLHPSIRAARAFERTLDNMTIYILPEEILVGNRSSKLLYCSKGSCRIEFRNKKRSLLQQPC